MATRTNNPTEVLEVAHERLHFHSLLATDPNYFGSLPGLGFEPQREKQGDTGDKELSCVGFSPERGRSEATVLSWEIVPNPNQPDQVPVWGNVHHCHIQVQRPGGSRFRTCSRNCRRTSCCASRSTSCRRCLVPAHR